MTARFICAVHLRENNLSQLAETVILVGVVVVAMMGSFRTALVPLITIPPFLFLGRELQPMTLWALTG